MRLRKIEINVRIFVPGIKRQCRLAEIRDIRADLNQRQTNIHRSDKSALRYCLHLDIHPNIWKIRFLIALANGRRIVNSHLVRRRKT